MLPPRSWNEALSARRLRPRKRVDVAYTCAPSEASMAAASPSIRLLSMCTLAARADTPTPVALM